MSDTAKKPESVSKRLDLAKLFDEAIINLFAEAIRTAKSDGRDRDEIEEMFKETLDEIYKEGQTDDPTTQAGPVRGTGT